MPPERDPMPHQRKPCRAILLAGAHAAQIQTQDLSLLYVAPGATIGGAGTSNSTSFTINGSIMVGNGTDATSQTTLTATSSSTLANAALTFNLGVGANQGESNTLNLGATPLTCSNTTLDFNLVGRGSLQPDTSFTLITTGTAIDATADGLTLGSNGQIIGGLNISANSYFGTSVNGYTTGSYNGSCLYINGNNINVQVGPEPSAWNLLMSGFGLLTFVVSLRRCVPQKG
jgi:hypothetical protein